MAAPPPSAGRRADRQRSYSDIVNAQVDLSLYYQQAREARRQARRRSSALHRPSHLATEPFDELPGPGGGDAAGGGGGWAAAAGRRLRGAFTRKILERRLPIVAWLPRYSAEDAAGDLVAGLTVGLTVIPQALAYANVAGLPAEPLARAQYGLYSSFVGCFVYAVLGSCKDVPMGPSALMALLTRQVVRGGGPALASLLCFLCGCAQLLMAALGLGFVIDFVSGPVSSGFTSASALLIVTSQLGELLGVQASGDTCLDMWVSLGTRLPDTRPADAALGAACVLLLLGLRLVARCGSARGPPLRRALWLLGTARNAVLVLASGAVGFWLSARRPAPLRLIGYVPPGLPAVQPPPPLGPAPAPAFTNGTDAAPPEDFLSMAAHLGWGLAVVPLVALLEDISVCKAFSGGRPVDATQELLATGASNFANSLVQGFPGTGAFSRSAVNNASGVRTPLGGVYTGLLVVLSLLFFTPYFAYIPKAALAAIIIAAVIFMVEAHVVVPMWKTKKSDLVPGLGAFLACLLLRLEQGVLVGIGLNVLFILYHAARPKIALEYQRSAGGSQFLLLRPDRCLIFPSVEYVRGLVTKHSLRRPLPVVIDCSHVSGADYTAAKVVECLTEDFALRRQPLFFYRLKPSLEATFRGLQPRAFAALRSLSDLDAQLAAHEKQAAAAAAAEAARGGGGVATLCKQAQSLGLGLVPPPAAPPPGQASGKQTSHHIV